MKNKLHTSNHVTSSLSRSHKINKLLIILLFPLWGLGGYSQTFNWDWAVSGGGAAGGTQDEQIYDIKVGTDNNYYFIAPFYGGSGHQLDGQSLPTYNVGGSAAKDILLFSTTCDGTIRWSHVLGGGSQDDAYNLVLDSQDNVYIGIRMGLGSTTHQKPVYFSPTDSLPLTPAIEPSDYYKTTFLVKFSSTGQYIGKKALQGDVGSYYPSLPSNFNSAISDLVISNDTLHFIVGLQYGLHLDDNVTVPSKYHYDPLNPSSGAGSQFHLAKYDTNLNYISSMILPIADNTGFIHETTRFVYDETLNRYYLAGMRSANVTASILPFTYGGKDFVERSFILGIDGSNGNELWRREIYAHPVNNIKAINSITSVIIDTNSDVYIAGKLYNTIFPQNLPMKIYNPHDSINTTYTFTPAVDTDMAAVIKFNSSGTVQWVKTPTAFAPNYTSNKGGIIPKGLAIKNNEVALASAEGYFIWDSFTQNYPQFHGVAPTLLRFDKQTGTTIGMHWIDAGDKGMKAVAVDKDGNYITGGFFIGTLFSNTPGITPLYSAGQSDFFVAKLGAYACGTNSTAKFNNIKVNVYPNPTNDIINIETDETLLNYVVYDMNGREIQSGMFGSSNQLNLQNATNGVYFVKVTTVHNNVATVKVIKK